MWCPSNRVDYASPHVNTVYHAWSLFSFYQPEAVCTLCSLIRDQTLFCSFQINTRPSYEHEARIEPNFGCAQDTCHTGASCLEQVTIVSVFSPSSAHKSCFTLLKFQRDAVNHRQCQRFWWCGPKMLSPNDANNSPTVHHALAAITS